ncbi:hypothetical protein [Rhodanobacter sp. MP1X3]|uniref:hypothetical protein n=1 Tax=Rhodanobacter sp. MP1X3 TaxID=2723086 RepID=UPI00161BFFC9|nr:hypothetical protein [Rhodanobacter sp. MP1X3]MBB6244234.1 hypothetical protein [Rhodanobacter sp. MP1X3]
MTNTSQIPAASVECALSASATIRPASPKQAVFSRRLLTLLVVAPIGIAVAATPPAKPPAKPAPPASVPRIVIVQPSANAQFQQAMRQAQLRGQLQQAQVEQQNHQAVRDNSRRPYDNNSQMQQQMDQADAAQQRTDRARQQSIIDRYNTTPPPSGRLGVPANNPPSKPASGG